MIKRFRYTFTGTVQGVGFRPFVYRVATELDLAGFVLNSPGGVIAEIQGPDDRTGQFLPRIQNELPPLAALHSVAVTESPLQNEAGFEIRPSCDEGDPQMPIPPDVGTCAQCRQELFDPDDRRFRYPFINCTNCGPRLTIVSAVPYDRASTSMACFPLCSACRREYEDPGNRRFHAEPNACADCGPALQLLDGNGCDTVAADPVTAAIARLKEGAVVAVKGLGGYHLSVDAANDAAVLSLRKRKYREAKPLAIMVRDLEHARRLARISAEEQALLESPERPIVLVPADNRGLIAGSVAPGMPCLGIMLPGTPLHHLLLEGPFTALVMTSANQTDEPICIGNREATDRLKGIADYFLVHNRDILVRCDDSIAMLTDTGPAMLRRARGFVPGTVGLRNPLPEVLAVGPHLKATVCITKGAHAYLGPHIGDMQTPRARDFFHESIALMQRLTQCTPTTIACDRHPGYYSTRFARDAGAETLIEVQHHHAHIVSCMADNNISGRVIGLTMDGTGYGDDGCIWGGECLTADETGFERAGHLIYLPLPGGETAIREPWRIAAALLRHAFGEDWQSAAVALKLSSSVSQLELLDTIMQQGLNCPLSSSLGRLFDGIAALIGTRRQVSFEGQAAMELEGLAAGGRGSALAFDLAEHNDIVQLDPAALIREIVSRLRAGGNPADIAASFHLTVCEALAGLAERTREKTGLARVVLSGGCFQNRRLLVGCTEALTRRKFEVFSHRRVPTNDGGISLGQAVSAGYQLLHA